ncbi:hypothetical protein NDU88_001432 [Pleurodeles waltl]|uniref:Uncharacterized protein n=1 Tax=Pleurodeles waltl TaxID=8319 RepID=A0AAV7Q3N6_PLEWA|nr:hypothetical protein NDU88_001432 [Pleurodeles waltl]
MTPARPGAIHPWCRWSRLQSPGWSLFRRDGWCVALGAAPAAPVGLLRSGPVRCSPGYLGRRANLTSARSGPPIGAAHQRQQALPRPGFLRHRGSGGHQHTPRVPVGTNRIDYGSGFRRMTEGLKTTHTHILQFASRFPQDSTQRSTSRPGTRRWERS